jgi:L-2-hydroxycarboxylate dehydrogenase (NAD+)
LSNCKSDIRSDFELTTVSVPQVEQAAITALVRGGVPLEHAQLQASLLIEAELRGRPSHGLLRLNRLRERIANGVASATAKGRHEWRGAFLSVDGEMGLGPIVAQYALDAMEQQLAQTGIAVAAISNSNHIGMLAFYAERVAARGLVCIALSTSEALVHPYGGRTAMLGTNPIAIGVPTAGVPFVFDMATSLVSMGQIHDYANRGQELPEGWALDADGNPTTDALAAKSGSIAPFGAAKGYALGLAFEVLVTALSASAIGRDVVGTLDSDKACNKGDVFIVIDPNLQRGTADTISAYLDAVRASGGDQGSVLVPGDRALADRTRRLKDGIDLPAPLWEQLVSLGN